jgi:homoserine O-succinyltransferase/O-acetyltransferase
MTDAVTDKIARIAILDMNNGVPNQGLRCIREIVSQYDHQVEWNIYDVRAKGEIPDLSYDIYICSGGPDSPLAQGEWRNKVSQLIDEAGDINASDRQDKKFIFFICYSFQFACHHFGLGDLTMRKSTSFGIYPIHKTAAGRKDRILDGLDDPYYAVDSRDWQVVQPRLKVFTEHGASILSLEKIRTHVEYERAIMAVRFSDYFVGTQFHPEADADGMLTYFSQQEMKNKVVKNYGIEKYDNMIMHLHDPDKIERTHGTILPNFINNALETIKEKKLQLH